MPNDPKQLPKQTLPPQTDPATSAAAPPVSKSTDEDGEQHVSTGRLEQGPVLSTAEKPAGDEPAEAMSLHSDEVKIAPEIKHVVEAGPDGMQPKIDQDVGQAGVRLAKESTPIIHTPVGDLPMPMTYTQAMQKKTSTNFYDSMHWLAAMVLFQWKKYGQDAIQGKSVKQV